MKRGLEYGQATLHETHVLTREVQGTDQHLPAGSSSVRRRNGSSSSHPGKGNTDTIACQHRLVAGAGNTTAEDEPGDMLAEAEYMLAEAGDMLAEPGDIRAEAEPRMLAEPEDMLAEAGSALARWGHLVASLKQKTNSRASPAPSQGCGDSYRMRHTCIARPSSSLLLEHYIPD